MNSERSAKIWNEIQEQVKKETGEKLPGEMAVDDFIQLMSDGGVELGYAAARLRLEKLVRAGKLTKRKIFVRSRNASTWLYMPVE